jgi:hypothetical protein
MRGEAVCETQAQHGNEKAKNHEVRITGVSETTHTKKSRNGGVNLLVG